MSHDPIRLTTLALLGAVAACGLTGQGTPTRPGQGRLAISMVDAPTGQVTQIMVNVTKVTAHSTTAGWVTVSPPSISESTPLAVDLLTLQAPATAVSLGLVDLPPGTITQLRLYVTQTGNFVVPAGGTAHADLIVPSGTQSGIKIHGPWNVGACSETSVTLDFDGHRSIWYHPEQPGAEWVLRPVIHSKRSGQSKVGCGEGCSDTNPCAEGETCQADGTCTPATPPSGDGGSGAACSADTDCVSGSTCSEGACTVPPGSKPVGGTCIDNAECLSDSCAGGACEAGGQGANCGASTDCQEGMTCTAGLCDSVVPL